MPDINLDNLWNEVFVYIYGPQFLLIAIFVVATIEVLKLNFKTLENSKWFSTLNPFIALILAFLGVAVLNHDRLLNIHDWIIQGITQAFLVDIFYTYAGKPLLQFIKLGWTKLLETSFGDKLFTMFKK